MKILLFKAPCPVCRKVVLQAKEESSQVQYFEVKEAKMLVIVATPEVDGQKRIALGPCQSKEPFHREDEEPVIYFAHPKHGCQVPPLPTEANRMDTSTGTTISNSGQATSPVPVAPEMDPLVLPPIVVPVDPLRISQ